MGRDNLKMILELPLYMLFEIFSTVTSLNLLYPSRTPKFFRAMLASRMSATVWRAVFTLEPELLGTPKDLNEPKWANIIFSKHYHTRDQYVLMDFRIRICGGYMSENYGSLSEVTKQIKEKLMCNGTNLFRCSVIIIFIKYGSGRAPKALWGYADSNLVNLQLARLKMDKVAFEAPLARRME
ncbi:hypothetical protein BDZ94DRAFT_367179 [Collybia nuda]|uniref:F-box domain-containing protein n=1 Tax=Collybia nuda TaxID=64659 RepID=A0A9P5YFZ5_9AGAR|nr:hypothetical protein BDZ94DRAFT_367179 [Collybia nuda]